MSLRCASRTCMRAMQTLRERGNHSCKTMQANFKPPSSSSSSSQARGRVVSTALEQQQPSTTTLRKRREAEKAENVMHLVCWGPN